MNIKDYMHFNDLSCQQFADRCGINLQTLYGVMKGKNTRYFDICRIIAATHGAVEIWDILPAEIYAEIEVMKKEIHEKEHPGQIQLPSNEELMERARKARWGSKFTGMCC